MRLLHTRTLTLQEFFDAAIPEYAILSHTWGDYEITYQRFVSAEKKEGRHFEKILDCCELAASQGMDWVWIDTCCIDKTSSAELSEAINSMFLWYQRSKICFVFLSDLKSSVPYTEENLYSLMSSCRWFTRGFTLQELLAPSNTLFYDSALKPIGSTTELATHISRITGIGQEYLIHASDFREASIAQRMSWASHRQTSRLEDTAYCLLGLFDVNMPLLYGEGRKAFLRLQQEIIALSSDESIFAWMAEDARPRRGLFAEWPSEFKHSGSIYRVNTLTKRPPYTVCNRGLQLHIPTSPWKNWLTLSTPQVLDFVELWLDCVHESPTESGSTPVVGIRIRSVPSHNDESAEWYRVDATKLVLRDEKRMHVAENFLFGSWHPIYAVQSTIASNAQPLRAQRAATLEKQDLTTSFDRKSSRNVYQILEALCMSLWLLYIGIFPIRGYSLTFSYEAAWTWHYITYGFLFRRSNFRFHVIVCAVLYARQWWAEAVFWYTVSSPMVIMGSAILVEIVADRFRTFFHRRFFPAKKLDGRIRL